MIEFSKKTVVLTGNKIKFTALYLVSSVWLYVLELLKNKSLIYKSWEKIRKILVKNQEKSEKFLSLTCGNPVWIDHIHHHSYDNS